MDTLMGRYRNVSILAAAIFLQIVGLAVQVKRHAENQSTRLIRVWTVAAITPLEKNIVGLQAGVSEVWHNYLYLRGVRQENRQLQSQIEQLQLEQVRLRQDAEQARRLQALLGFKEQFIDKTIAAQVIGSSGSEQSRIIYLDKGSSDGIAQDMAVISSQGVVGKVIQVFRHTSQVLLINDQTSGVGTILEQSRLQGVLKGKASGEIVLDKIMAEEEVKPGERVLTSGGDQIFPKGLTVGTVANVSRAGEFVQVKVQPAAALNHLEEVLVITKKLEREPQLASTSPVRAADILAERLPSVPDAAPATAANKSTAVNPEKATPTKTPTGITSSNDAQKRTEGQAQVSEPKGHAEDASSGRGTAAPSHGAASVPPQLSGAGTAPPQRLVPASAQVKAQSESGNSAKPAISQPGMKKSPVAQGSPAQQTAKPANAVPAQPSATGDVPQ